MSFDRLHEPDLLERFTAPPVRRRRESGSAYLVALIVLVVLSIIGLSLSLITQTEMRVGANERIVQRVFYAADSGVSTSTARTLVEANTAPHQFRVPDPDTLPALNLHQEVDVSPFFPIQSVPCNLCSINRRGMYQQKEYVKITYGVTTVAQRKKGADPDVLAEKVVSAMVSIEPSEKPAEAFLPINDPEQVKKIKF